MGSPRLVFLHSFAKRGVRLWDIQDPGSQIHLLSPERERSELSSSDYFPLKWGTLTLLIARICVSSVLRRHVEVFEKVVSTLGSHHVYWTKSSGRCFKTSCYGYSLKNSYLLKPGSFFRSEITTRILGVLTRQCTQTGWCFGFTGR